MADKKPVRVQFGKNADRLSILAGIRKAQDEWAKANPETAHRLYPDRYAADGSVIAKPK